MKFRGYFHPAYNPRTTGLNKQGGEFWVGFINDQDESDGLARIELTVPAESSPSQHTFASIRVHADGVKVIRKLDEVGFLTLFEEIHASTFYDLVQCFARCDIPIIYHGDYGNELVSREMYELLYEITRN